MKSEAPLVLPCTCAELFQVVAEVNVQLSYLERDPDRRDKPRCKAGVHTGARRQCFRRHQLITGQLGSTVAVRTGGETTPVSVYIFAIMMKKLSLPMKWRRQNMSNYICAAQSKCLNWKKSTKLKVKAWLLTKHQNSIMMNSEHDSHLWLNSFVSFQVSYKLFSSKICGKTSQTKRNEKRQQCRGPPRCLKRWV